MTIEDNKKRNSLKFGQLKSFEVNKGGNNLGLSSNKENIFNGKNINRNWNSNDQFGGNNSFNFSNKKVKENYSEESIDNFTSPEPYNFYLHSSNSDLSVQSTQTYNRKGSKNYFVSETPTPFLYNDIVNKGRLTDTTKKNKPTSISNGNSYHTQNQKFYSNSYGLNLDRSEREDDFLNDEINSDNKNNNKNIQDLTSSIWSVSPPFSATRTDDTNLDAVVEEDEFEKNNGFASENSMFNTSGLVLQYGNNNNDNNNTINTINNGSMVETEASNADIYDQEEPITFNNDYQPEESNEFIEPQSLHYEQPKDLDLQNKIFTSSSASSSSINHSRKNSFSQYNNNTSFKSLPKARSSTSINQVNDSSLFSNSRSLTSPPPYSSTSGNSILKNRINNNEKSSYTGNSKINSNGNFLKNNMMSGNSTLNQKISSSTIKPKISSIRKSIIGNYYTLMEKNKIGSVHKRLNASKFTKERQKQPLYSNEASEVIPDEEFYYDSDNYQEDVVNNQKYHSNVSLGVVEYISLFIYKIFNIVSLLFYIIWKLLSSRVTILFLLLCIYFQIFLVDENGSYSLIKWLNWAKLPEQDSHHQKILNLEDQLVKLEGILAKLNLETEEIKADTPQNYLDKLNKEIENLSLRLANVAEEASQSSLVNTRQKQDIQNLKHLSSNIEVNFNDLKSNVQDFHHIIQQVETKIDADKENQIEKLKQSLEPMLEKIIPNIMIAKINPNTRAIEFDERFWRYLSKNFLTIDSLKSLIKSHDEALEEMNKRAKVNIPTWDDFIESNRQMLESYINKEFQQQLKQGDIIISKEDVISLVQSEFHRYLVQLNTSIPELHDAIQGYIDKAMEKYSIDISSKPDYALESSGAQIVPQFTSESYHRYPEGTIAKAWANIFGMSGVLLGKSPVVALQPDTHAGNCWAMNGNHGYLTVQLSMPIIPSHITIEHMSQEESVPDSLLSSSPKEIEVYGITDQTALEKMSSNHGKSLSSSPYAMHLASIVFDPRDNFIQTFPISNEAKIRLQSVTSIKVVQFQIYSNWGESKYTCIYRVRIHGREVLMK